MQCLVDAGLLSNDMVKYLESMYPNYVTISRDLQDSTYAGDKNKTGVNAPHANFSMFLQVLVLACFDLLIFLF